VVEPIIRQGDSGERVRDVQRRLRALANPGLAVDGHFSEQTRQAVLRFQQERGLGADGIVGSETWRNLVEAGWRLGTRLLWYSQQMMRGDDVRELQHRLNQLGFDAGTEDGIFGPLARAAVEDFQRNVGLAVDGVAGPETIAMLRRFQRAHQSGGLGVQAREREWLRRLAGRGLTGTRIVIDPAHGPDDPGAVGPTGTTEAGVTWEIATRLAGRLGAQGAAPLLTRGPATDPQPAQRGHRGRREPGEASLAGHAATAGRHRAEAGAPCAEQGHVARPRVGQADACSLRRARRREGARCQERRGHFWGARLSHE
jgi:N-acetylmuramoyl-L-alanine amidase